MPKSKEYSKANRLEAYEVVSKLIDAIYKGDASDEMQKRMIRWLISDVNEDIKFDAFEQAMHKHLQPNEHPDEIDRKEFEALLERLGIDKSVYQKRHRKTTFKIAIPRIILQIAAVLLPLILFIGGYMWYESKKMDTDFVATNQVSVSNNENRELVLEDGTEVILNKNSEFSYNNNRQCSLKGEGYFKVAKGRKPFVIYTDNMNVTVLGTEFNLSAYPDNELSVVTLYTGTVNLNFRNGSRKLIENQEFTYNNTTGEMSIHPVGKEIGEAVPAWVKENTSQIYSLGEILNIIESEYGVIIENKQIPDTTQPYTFMIGKGESIDTVLSALKIASGDFDYRKKGNKIIIEPVKK